MKKNLSILFFILWTLTVVAQGPKFIGTFRTKTNPDSSFRSYTFKSDSTYTSVFIRPGSSQYAGKWADSGKWELKRRKLILHYVQDSMQFKEKVYLKENPKSKELILKIGNAVVYPKILGISFFRP